MASRAFAPYARQGPFGLPFGRGLAILIGSALACALLAFGLAQVGSAGLLVGAGGLVLLFGLLLVRNKSLLLLAAFGLGLQLVFHKSIGTQSALVSSGPLAIYITSLDLLVVALYGLWFVQGGIFGDLSALLRSGVFLVPLLGGLAEVPSILMAENLNLALAEMLRMAFGFALYVYVSQRVRTHREVAFILGALLLMAIMQFAFVAVEWRTGSSLGLTVLGEENNLTTRSVDNTEIPRPSGTTPHPDLMAALVAPVALLALSLAINLRGNVWLRLTCLAAAAIAAAPPVLAQTRAALVGEAAGMLLLVAYGLWRKRLAPRIVLGAAFLALAVGFVFRDDIAFKVFANAGTDHFQLEVQSRLELNGLALDMIRDFPVLGVGLNNFQTIMHSYDTYGLIFAGNPVHNLFLLVMAETGAVGLIGLIATFVVLIALAIRLALQNDGFLSGVGAGVVAVYLFFLLEEQLMFALRHDMPRMLFWLLAGLVVACWQMSRLGDEPVGAARAE